MDCLVGVQAAWRGYKVRAASGRAGRDARRRLAAASAAAAAAPHKRIGVRAREALTVLLGSKQCSQVGRRNGREEGGCQRSCLCMNRSNTPFVLAFCLMHHYLVLEMSRAAHGFATAGHVPSRPTNPRTCLPAITPHTRFTARPGHCCSGGHRPLHPLLQGLLRPHGGQRRRGGAAGLHALLQQVGGVGCGLGGG